MENNRPSRKKYDEEAPMSEDDTLYVTAPDQPGQITINLEKDTKRKITIISEVEAPKRPRRGSVDLRRQAIVNNAIRSSQSTASSRSRSRSRSRGRARSTPRNRSRSARSTTRSRSRSLSTSRRSPKRVLREKLIFKDQKESAQDPLLPKLPKDDQTHSLRLPTHLCQRSIVGRKGTAPPECIQLPSPLFILTEQQVTGASEKKTVQFVTKILLTSHKLSHDDRKKLYAEMVEAEYVGTSRSSKDLVKSSDDEPDEDFQLKIYYSTKGVYIHSVQNVIKVRKGKSSKITEEKSYHNICKTKIVGDQGKSIEGFLNVTCSETVSVVNQNYSRSENFKIGLKDLNVIGNCTVNAIKATFDPTKTSGFKEVIKFDNKNIGLDIFHTSTAAMQTMWDHEVGSFGEEQSEYREVRFVFDDEKEKQKNEQPGVQVSQIIQNPKPSGSDSKSSSVSSGNSSASSSANNSSASSRRSRSRAKRHKAIQKALAKKSSATSKSPDRQSSKKLTRPDEEPIKSKDFTFNHSSFYHSFPEATSTPKSPSAPLNSSTILDSKGKSPQVTPEKNRRGPDVPSTKEEKHSDTEVDLDKSLTSKKSSSASRNLALMIELKKKEEARQQDAASSLISAKPPTSPGNSSVYLYPTTGSANSTYMTAKDSTSPQGIRRVKETKVTREVREEDGKPAEINEKKEETVKEEKVKLGKRSRSVSPATPKMKRPLNNQSLVTLSAVKETHQTLEMTPIKVSEDSAPVQSTSINSGQRAFKEEVQLTMLIDKKRLHLNVNFILLAEKQPEVEITGFCFKGQKLWEKSSEWNLSSANTTSHTKTVARQASDILGDGK
ncbi:hypothetical protein L5515_003683 [Caenorhabditis briggsae]|uniref:Uncharacterized protein n=1 Tax=Caenorhabditis briggsae TaxID=6238 RepID=A0AAE9JAS3_CAEBR|nr:hypothetical protein L5515_003683 [Caenorhabditis briggsae]